MNKRQQYKNERYLKMRKSSGILHDRNGNMVTVNSYIQIDGYEGFTYPVIRVNAKQGRVIVGLDGSGKETAIDISLVQNFSKFGDTFLSIGGSLINNPYLYRSTTPEQKIYLRTSLEEYLDRHKSEKSEFWNEYEYFYCKQALAIINIYDEANDFDKSQREKSIKRRKGAIKLKI